MLFLFTAILLLLFHLKFKTKTEKRAETLLNEHVTGTYGFIARTNSEQASNERIIQEINVLKGKFEEVKKFGIYRSRFSL